MGEDEELKEEFAALVKGELDVWKSIMKGTAVQEHMEDVYHNVLKVAHPKESTPSNEEKHSLQRVLS